MAGVFDRGPPGGGGRHSGAVDERIRANLLWILLFTFLTVVALAVLAVSPAAAAAKKSFPQPVVVFDLADGRVLHAEHPDLKWHPASLAKLMTAYVAFEAIREGRISMDTRLLASWYARSQPKVKIYLRKGKDMSLRTAIETIIVRSANDASVMIAEAIGNTLSRVDHLGRCVIETPAVQLAGAGNWWAGGPRGIAIRGRIRSGHKFPESPKFAYGSPRLGALARANRRCSLRAFVKRMNDAARRLGMTNSVFTNPNGLPDRRQVSSARDLARLATALYRDFPEYAGLFALKSVTVRKRERGTYHDLLRTLDGADGMKTGFICAAGYNVVVSVTRGDRKIVAVILGGRSPNKRSRRAREIVERAFAGLPGPQLQDPPTIETMARDPQVQTGPLDIRHRLRRCDSHSYRITHRTVPGKGHGSTADDGAARPKKTSKKRKRRKARLRKKKKRKKVHWIASGFINK